MGPLILRNSPAKFDHQRPGVNGAAWAPAMKPIPRRQGKNVHFNPATSSTATNKPGKRQPKTSSIASVPKMYVRVRICIRVCCACV